MASDLEFAQYVCEQMQGGLPITYRKMFGEYAVYAGEKVVALVCDNQLFVKSTEAGRTLLGTPTEAPPFPGARNFFLIESELDDREFMARLIADTAHALPAPKAKRKAAKLRKVTKAKKAKEASKAAPRKKSPTPGKRKSK